MSVSLGPDDYQGYIKLHECLVTSCLLCNNLEGCGDLLGPLYPLFGIDFGVFKNFVGKVSWDMALESREIQECWLIFKDLLLNLKSGPSWREGSQVKVPGGLLGEQGDPDSKNQSVQEVEAGRENPGGI